MTRGHNDPQTDPVVSQDTGSRNCNICPSTTSTNPGSPRKLWTIQHPAWLRSALRREKGRQKTAPCGMHKWFFASWRLIRPVVDICWLRSMMQGKIMNNNERSLQGLDEQQWIERCRQQLLEQCVLKMLNRPFTEESHNIAAYHFRPKVSC